MWKNDIALVKLERAVPSGIEDLPRIQKITLNAAGNMAFPPAGQVCYMKGWGCTDNGLLLLFLNGQTPLIINGKLQHSKLQKLQINNMKRITKKKRKNSYITNVLVQCIRLQLF